MHANVCVCVCMCVCVMVEGVMIFSQVCLHGHTAVHDNTFSPLIIFSDFPVVFRNHFLCV